MIQVVRSKNAKLHAELMATSEFEFLDLFAGIGGFHAALSPFGGVLALASEIDDAARDQYVRNWRPNVGEASHQKDVNGQVRGDLYELNRLGLVPQHQVLTGGFPCQPFSKSGSQRGVAEPRGQLIFEILKVIGEHQPSIVLLENVRNLIGPRHVRDYERVLEELRALGYHVSAVPTVLSPHLLPEEHGGSPQHRERVFIVGLRANRGSSESTLDSMPPIVPRNPFPGWDPLDWNLRDFLRRRAPIEIGERKSLRVSSETQTAVDTWNEFLERFRARHPESSLPSFPLWTEYWRERSRLRIPADTPDWKRKLIDRNSFWYTENRRLIDPWLKRADLETLSPSFRKFEWQAGALTSLSKCLLQARPSGLRVKRPNYAPALVAIGQTPILGWDSRELSIREAAVLQGFSPDLDFSTQPRTATMKQLGNAVHVGVAQYVFLSSLERARAMKLKWVRDFI